MALIRTGLLLGALTGLLLAAGWLLGGQVGALVALVMAGALNFASYWWSDKIVLAMYRAKPSGDRALNSMVKRLAAEAGIPVPKVYIVDTPVSNAFATGRSPRHAAVAATSGILEQLDEEELEGVLAHELGHIKNRDTLISAMAATLAGAISFLAHMAWYASFGQRDGRGSAAILFPLVILAPLAAGLVQLAISRGREFGADETGARLTKKPLALASALQKISAIAKARPMQGNPATAHLWIVNPFSAGALAGLFSTHPPTEARVARLRELSNRLK